MDEDGSDGRNYQEDATGKRRRVESDPYPVPDWVADVRRQADEEVREELDKEDDEFWADMFEEELDQVPVVVHDDVERELFGDDAATAGEGPTDQPEEGRAPRRRPMPHSPTAAEIEEHECTHVPYRPWCVCLQKSLRTQRLPSQEV